MATACLELVRPTVHRRHDSPTALNAFRIRERHRPKVMPSDSREKWTNMHRGWSRTHWTVIQPKEWASCILKWADSTWMCQGSRLTTTVVSFAYLYNTITPTYGFYSSLWLAESIPSTPKFVGSRLVCVFIRARQRIRDEWGPIASGVWQKSEPHSLRYHHHMRELTHMAHTFSLR